VATLTDVVPGEQLSFFEIAERLKQVLQVDVKLKRASSLDDLATTINPLGADQNPLAFVHLDYLRLQRADCYSAAAYYFEMGKISLGSNLDNQRYPEVKPETFTDFLRRVEGK
jgi:hypothetical protein